MKSIAGKIKKQRRRDVAKTSRSCCGTLSYMAECRGAVKKTRSIKWQVPPDGINKMIRNFPAV